MDPRKLPEEKVVKVLIYGVKSSGNRKREAYSKLQDYQVNNTQRSMKLFKMIFMEMTAYQEKKMLKKLYKEQMS